MAGLRRLGPGRSLPGWGFLLTARLPDFSGAYIGPGDAVPCPARPVHAQGLSEAARWRAAPTAVRRARVIALLVLAVGVLGAAAAVRYRESDTQFIAGQQSLVPIGSVQLADLLALSRDPRPGHGGGRARGAVCQPFGSGQLRNPWSCVVTYPTPPRVRYRVTVANDRSIQGESPGQNLNVHGCCVASGS